MWVQLRQYPWWEDLEVRREVTGKLAEWLKINLARGEEVAQLASLWLETLREERNPVVLHLLREKLDSFLELRRSADYEKITGVWNDLLKGLEGRNMNYLPANARHNLGVVTFFLLNERMSDFYNERGEKIFMEFCGDETWASNRIPAGWEVLCREIICASRKNYSLLWLSNQDPTRICEMALLMNRIGNTTNDKRFHQLFRETLFEIIRMKPENPDLVSVAESALWYEVVRLCKATEKLAPGGKPQDEAGQRRWLREFLRSYGQTGGGATKGVR